MGAVVAPFIVKWIRDVLTAEIDAIYRQHTIGGKKSENPHLILSECEGICVAAAMAAIAQTMIGYVSSMVKCGTTRPGYGLCAGLATAYKTAKLISAGITLYACIEIKCGA